MTDTLNMTPQRVKLLSFLCTVPQYARGAIADFLAPRKHGWSGQGAARWAGGYLAPLEQAGLVKQDKCKNLVWITDAGRKLIEGIFS